MTGHFGAISAFNSLKAAHSSANCLREKLLQPGTRVRMLRNRCIRPGEYKESCRPRRSIRRANHDTVRVFATKAGLSNNVSHRLSSPDTPKLIVPANIPRARCLDTRGFRFLRLVKLDLATP